MADRHWARRRGRPPRRGRRAAGLAAVLAAVVLVLAAGCANVPSSGLLQSTNLPSRVGGEQQGSDCCGLIMNGPRDGWSPAQIVVNFILASADFTGHRAVARQYLTPSASASWQPGPGPAVTVISQPPTPSPAYSPFGTRGEADVQIGVQVLGQVTASGQYIPAPGGQAEQQQGFTLVKVHGQWRIDRLPTGTGRISHELMLTKELFQLAYQPRDLYYLDSSGKHLVPDPVFVPVDTTSLASDLVNALRASPQGWLADGVLSAFPPAAHLLRPVEVPPGSKTAIVSLSLPRAAATNSSVAQISAQLVWTLTSQGFRSPAISAVKLYINGKAWTPPGAGTAVQSRSDYPQPALNPAAGQNLYFLTSGGAARVLRGQEPASVPAPGQAGTGQDPLSGIAVSPDEKYLAGVAGPASAATVYTEDLVAAARQHASSSARALQSRLTGVTVTALSWDNADNLWIAGRQHGQARIWVLSAAGGAPVPVALPVGATQVSALRVAADGVRVAMIANTASGPQVLLAAIVWSAATLRTEAQVTFSAATQIGADLSAPIALSWYDADHLLVVNASGAGRELEEVPVDGDRSSYQGIEPGMAGIAAAGSRNSVVAGLQTGYLARTVGLGELWSQFVPGHDPVFPG